MKCPKCGYHSFDYLDRCKKCDNDLSSFKSKFNLRSLIFPHLAVPDAAAPETEEDISESPSPAAPVAAAATTDFGFDFMDESSTPSAPKPEPFESPEMEEIPVEASQDEVPAEDDTFSWDEEPPAVELGTGPETEEETEMGDGPTEDFDWGEDTSPEPLPEEEALEETAENDDTFGLDLSWDSTAAEEDQPQEDEPLETMDAGELPDWDFDEEPSAETKKDKKNQGQEEPSDPFELRGRDAGVLSPVTTETEVAIQEELPFEPELELDPEPELEAETEAAVAGINASAVDLPTEEPTNERPWAEAEEDLLTALDEGLSVPAPSVATLPSTMARVMALVIDLLILAIAILLFLAAGQAALEPSETERLLPSPETLLNLAVPYFLVLFFVCFGYFTLFHFLTGQTPGKMLLRLRVEAESGDPLAFSQAFLRSTGGLFSLLPLGVGFLMILFDSRRRGWNDRLAGTLVIPALPVQETDEEAEDDS